MNHLPVSQSTIEENVHTALKEDIGDGDITAELIAKDSMSLATVITREDCTFCGTDWFEEAFNQINQEVLIDWNVDDGDKIKAGQTICTLSGPSRAIVTGERTAINFIQTLSSTATRSALFAAEVADTKTIVLDTRKTIPGLRIAQKYAVSCGGCQNHRIGLYDAFLIKENHISACKGIANAVSEARFYNPELPIEVEVENLDELEQAINAGADRVLLDNFDIKTLEQAVAICENKIITEVSGNVTIERLKTLAATGVNFISTGAITKDIKAVDFSMRFD